MDGNLFLERYWLLYNFHAFSTSPHWTELRVYFLNFLADPLYKIRCSADQMVVEMIKPLDVKAVYLEHLKNYPGNNNGTPSIYDITMEQKFYWVIFLLFDTREIFPKLWHCENNFVKSSILFLQKMTTFRNALTPLCI